MVSEIMIYERNPDIKWQLIEEKTVLINAADEELVHFNETGTFVWQKLDGKTSFDDILAELNRELGIPFGRLEKDITKFVRQLHDMELVRKVVRHREERSDEAISEIASGASRPRNDKRSGVS